MRMMIAIAALWAGAAAAEGVFPEDAPARILWLSPQIAVLGEVHDNPEHHAVQAAVVAALKPKALVYEMVTEAEAAATRGADRADASALASALGWPGSGWPDFAMYHPIFLAAPEAAIFGAEEPEGWARRAMTEGAAGVFGEGAARFGLDRALPEAEQAAREEEQFTAHCEAMPREMMAGMVEAQRLRDAMLARAALQALEATGGPVAVITGSGHARADWGVPALLAQAAPGVRVVSLGQMEGEPGAVAPFDLWVATPPLPREDPCAAFTQD